MQTVSFTPITVTVETLQILSKETNYANLLALYMACVEITTWQKNNSIKASRNFMMKRLNWGENRLSKAKARLVELGLLENVRRTKKDGTVEGHYVLVKHVIHTPLKPSAGFEHGVDSEGTSANDLQLNANDSKTILPTLTKQKKDLLVLVNKVTNRNFRTLPERGVKKTLDAFSMVEIEYALRALAADDWHRERLSEFKIDYLIRSTTIDKFLGKAAPESGDAYGYKNGEKIFTEDDKGNKFWGGELITPQNQDQVLKERMAE